MMNRSFLIASALAAGIVFTAPAHAQLEQQTGSADVGRIDRELSRPELTVQAGPDISIQNAPPLEAPEGAEDIRFTLGGVQFIDAQSYSDGELSALYQDMVGTEISLADVYALANTLTLKYRDDGYILTRVIIPPQTIEGGVIQLQAVEGFIDNITVQGEGEGEAALQLIRDYASRIRDDGTLTIETLERNLLLINDLPGVSARSVISPSLTTPGGADLLIIVNREHYEAELGMNNHGSRFLGPFQVYANGVAKSLYGWNESITAQFVTAPDAGAELTYGSIIYAQPVGKYGTVLSAGFSITDTDPGYTLDPFGVNGLSRTISLQAKHPIIRSRESNLTARLGFDWRDTTNKNIIEPTRKDYLRVLRAGAQYDFVDRLMGVAVNAIDIQISQGIDGLGASDKGDSNMSRPDGDPSFTKAEIQIQRLQRVTSSVNVLLQGRAQLANNALLSSEEFGLGGYSSVRGYEPSEVVGDDGMSGKIELQWNTPADGVQAFTFLDSGTVWDKDSTTSANKRNSLTSTGIGFRLDLPYGFDSELVAAQPMNRNIATRDKRDPQFFFSLSKQF